jgi:hypothetical protein
MAQIKRNYPGRSADEIYVKVHEVMDRLAQKLSLEYKRDDGKKSGQVSKMGIHGSYKVTEGEVVVDLKFPMIVPGTMKRKVQEDIERKLDGLFA